MKSWRTRITRPRAAWIGFAVALVTVVGSVAAFSTSRHKPPASASVLAAEVTATTAAPRPTTVASTTSPSTTTVDTTTTVPPSTTAAPATTSTAPRVIAAATASTTEPETTTTEAATTTTTIAATTTTVTPQERTIDLRVQGAFVGPPVANRATFVSVTVSNAGPHAALAPRVTVVAPTEYTDVVSLEPAWSCAKAGTGITCDGPIVPGGSSTSFALRGKLSEDIVLQADRPSASPSKPAVLTPKPLQFAVRDESNGATDIDPKSDTAELPFPSTIAAKGLATLTARTLHGGLAMAANTLLTCNAAAPACASAMVSGDNVSAEMTPTNTLGAVVAGTTASSSATLQLPSGATVSEAYLVWGAASMDGSGLAPDGLAVAWLSTAAGPTRVRTSLQSVGTNDFYARAVVTDLVRQQGSGVYGFGLVGGLAAVSGSNQSAGWALVVIYEHSAEPVRSVVVLDGLSVMGGGSSTSVELGALAPVAATRSAQVGFVTFDGDRGQADVVCVNGVRVSDAANPSTIGACDQAYPTDDAFNSTVSQHGVLQPVDAAGNTTSLGFDADLIDTALSVEASSRLTITATADVVRVGLIAIVIDR